MPEPSRTPIDLEGYSERWCGRLLADAEFQSAALELIEQAAADAGLKPPVDPTAFAHLLRGPKLQQQLKGCALGILRDLGLNGR